MTRLHKTVLLLTVGLLITSFGGIAQNSKDFKKVDKCWNVYKKKGPAAGIQKLRKYMTTKSFSSLYAHESLVRMERAVYTSGGGGQSGFTITTNGEVSDTIVDFMQLLNESVFKYNFVDVCRRSTLESTSPSGDRYLYELMIHFDPDTAVSEKSKSYFNEAEEFYAKEDYELAALNYRKAVTEDSGYYKANLFLGTAYLQMEEDDSALFYYEAARQLQPNLLEPRIFIINHLSSKGLYYRAKKECIEALTIYPGYNMKYKLSRILELENKDFNEHRITRNFYANKIGDDNQISMDHDPVWRDYRMAKDLAKLYCDKNGIIEVNGEIEDRYLEVFSFRNMLDKHQNDLPEILHFADKMKEEGYLEPYVFISQFHYDFYPQFKDYMLKEENRAKCVEYVEKYIITTKITG